MHLRSWIVALPCLTFAAIVAIVETTSKPDSPLDISVVSISELETTRLVTVDFHRCDPRARFAEAHQLQFCVAGRWQPPVNLPRFGNDYFLERTKSQRSIFSLPRQTEACRFLLGYRVGPSPYCQAGSFLGNHGFSKRFPKLSREFLNCVPRQPRLRRVKYELPIPTGAIRKTTVPPNVSASLLPQLLL